MRATKTTARKLWILGALLGVMPVLTGCNLSIHLHISTALGGLTRMGTPGLFLPPWVVGPRAQGDGTQESDPGKTRTEKPKSEPESDVQASKASAGPTKGKTEEALLEEDGNRAPDAAESTGLLGQGKRVT